MPLQQFALIITFRKFKKNAIDAIRILSNICDDASWVK